MLSIGDFARLGLVSVRMLRHYDGIGLLEPARVDPVTGYRWYDAAQLPRLNRILALKDLGFTLDQVSGMVEDRVSAEELRGMLRLRHAELVEQISADRQRLARVERRLRTIESEGRMSEQEYETKPIEAVRVVAVTSTVDGIEQVSTVVGPNFERLVDAFGKAGAEPQGHPIAYFVSHDDGRVEASSAFPYDGPADGLGDGVAVVDLPAVELAATTVHRGGMDTIGDTWQELVRHVEGSGHQPVGICREVYLNTPMDDPQAWVTELQQPLSGSGRVAQD